MRGSKAQIRIFEENAITRKLLLRSVGLYNVCMVIMYLLKGEMRPVLYLLRSIPEGAAIYYLYRISTPGICSEGKTQTLVSSGEALSSKGHVSVAFDFLFVSMLVKFLLLYTNKAWGLYTITVVSCCYEFVYKPFKTLRPCKQKKIE
ncbi:putative SRP-independent targeting protein 2 [Ordospora pajunii]|jgi:hypothetical protein|uniref:putative SRP-independent targeting protein 2 n=1 Tax=Ordospora pajunii TaxID=3039483 RepID=UPI00295266D4|nr:putative SRP-independent targeting protein 2 [Ordospora pajunii]KAH9411154.1 putative SRP-independent targeting protein 2 [Ordospora pajunii]